MSESKENKDLRLSNSSHRFYYLFFIMLFIISLLSFAIIYFVHSKNVENRFDKALQSYEQSISNIFNNLSISTNNQTNESIVSNNGTSSSCTSTRDRISINNNNIMNMMSSEGDGFDELKKSFEIGLDLLKASLSETMKNSNDVLTFWFAFLSVIMVVFSFAGYFINNNILEQSKAQLKMVEDEAKKSIEKIMDENNKYIQISDLFNLSREMSNNKDYDLTTKYDSIIKYNFEIIKLYGDIDNIKDKNHINNYAGAYYNIGKAKSDLGYQSEAIDYLDKSIKLNPNFSNAYVYRGIAYYKLGKYKDSLKNYNIAIDLDQNNDYAYANRGLVKEELRKLGEDSISIYDIIDDYNKSIKLKPKDFESYVDRARVKELIEDYKGAIEDYNKVIELNIKFPIIYFNRYFDKELLLEKIFNKDSNEYKKSFDDAYNDLDTAYNSADDQIKYSIEENIFKDGKEVAIKFCEDKGWNIKDIIIHFRAYISKLESLVKMTDKDSKEYKKSFDEAYNNLDTAYNLANEQLKEVMKNQIIGMAILENEVAIKFCEDKGWNIKDIIIHFRAYISKLESLVKMTDKDSKEYKKSFDEAYNDLETAYNSADDKLKVIIRNQVIGMAKQGNEVAIKFCKDKGWDIK